MVAFTLPSRGFVSNPRILPLILTVTVLVGIVVNFLQLGNDPLRCAGLLTNGTWLNPKHSSGSRLPLDNWQPDGCMLHEYTAQDIHDCVEQRHLVFIGDSTTRQVFWATARILNKTLVKEKAKKLDRHADYDITFDGIRMTFHWNPFLDLDTANHSNTVRELENYREQRLKPTSVSEQENAAAIFIGVGPWFVGEDKVSDFVDAFQGLGDALPFEDTIPIGESPMTHDDGIGPQVFFAPPVHPQRKARNKKYPPPADRIERIQDYLDEHGEDNNLLLMRSIPELIRNNFGAIVDPMSTGFHVINSVADTKANLFLNARCNAKLDRLHGYPYDRTCCTDYGRLAFPQLVAILLCFIYLILCVVSEIRALSMSTTPSSAIFNLDIGIFATALLACYWADRTQAFPKGSKQFIPKDFFFLVLIVLAVAMGSLYSAAKKSGPGDSETSTKLQDTEPLSRNQTDEWKGWMQAVILIYHWTGASGVFEIYTFIRILVAAYLFQSGFGHAVYFLKKKDFSFKRVASVLLRLNLLSCALPYIMNTDYMFYYFAPLISFWFLVIYAVFAILPRYNYGKGLYVKVAIAATICPGLMTSTPFMTWVFWFLKTFFAIKWDLHEWQFRLGLDGFIVYIGMLMGIASVESKLYHKILGQTQGLSGVIGFFAIGIYYFAIQLFTTHEKKSYNALHPFISFVPILSFIALRNMNSHARSWHLQSMAWLGRCSLETFTLQFHILLAADTKGILLLDIFGGGDGSFLDRGRSLLIIVPVFLFISSQVAHATNGLVKIITSGYNRGEEDGLTLMPKEGETSWLPNFGKMVAFRNFARDLRVRVGGMLLLMWLMNLLY